MSALMPSKTERPLRVCDVCNQADDHPRHVQPVRGGVPLVRHMDCCAARGCGICQATEAVTAGARGDELLATIRSGVLDDLDFGEG